MGKRISWGVLFLLLLGLFLGGADKSKKAYELIYKDVQILKQKVLELDNKIERNSEDIRFIREQLGILIQLTRHFQSEQASAREDQKKLPAQYQILLEKMETINRKLAGLSEELIEIKRASFPLTEGTERSEKEETEHPLPSQEEGGDEVNVKDEEKSLPSISPNLSPNEVYNMARSDYLKGNYELAIEGFSIYKTQFADSPLADDAIYWIGECYFSQKKYDQAIEYFNELILNYPTGDKVPAGYLKKGISLTEQGKKQEAISVFRILITKYPLEEETRIAQEKIRELESKNERYQ
jgi:tol-pal system protein YbgF